MLCCVAGAGRHHCHSGGHPGSRDDIEWDSDDGADAGRVKDEPEPFATGADLEQEHSADGEEQVTWMLDEGVAERGQTVDHVCEAVVQEVADCRGQAGYSLEQ